MAKHEYLHDGIRRIETGEVRAGSHASGIFGRCASDFESEIRVWFKQLLLSCRLQYEKDIRPYCMGVALDKTTLGNLIAGIECVAALKRECVGSYVPRATDVASFVFSLQEINKDWVRQKHREELEIPVIVERMKSMAVILDSLAADPQ